MILKVERYSIIWKLLPGSPYLLLAVTFLTWTPLCRAAKQLTGQPGQMTTRSSEAATGQQAIRQLEKDKPIEQELEGGQAHSYLVMMNAGQFLHAVVDQRGIDVAVRLFGPDGKQILEINSPDGAEGPEPILFIAEADGSYRLAVQSLDKSAPTGRYQVKIEELRAATPKDGKRIAAELAIANAEQLMTKGTAESLKGALEKYNEALLLMRDIGNRAGEASTLILIGRAYHSLGEHQKALEYKNQSLEIWREVGDRQEEGEALNSIGATYNSLGETQKALEYFNQALPLLQGAGSRSQAALSLNNIGSCYDSLGEKQKALEHFNLALQIWREVGVRSGEAAALNNIGLIYHSLGEEQKALEYYDQALQILRDIGLRSGEAVTLHNIGLTYDSLGEKQKALEYFNLALPLRRAVGDRRGEAYTLNNTGLTYHSLDEKQKALEYFNLALSLIRIVGDRLTEAIILSNIGFAYASLGDSQKALDYYNRSLLLSRDVKDRNTEAITLYRMARAERNRNNLLEARSNIEGALDFIESLRTKLASTKLRASYFASMQQHYDFYIDLLMRLHQLHPDRGYDAIALHASERARARILLEMLAEARADIRQGVEPALLERERSLKQLLDTKTEKQVQLLSGKHTEQQAQLVEKEIEQLLAQYQEVESLIRTKSPRYVALTQPRPLTLKEIQQEVVDADTLLLEYALGEDRSYLWAVTPDSVMTFELPKRADIEKTAQRVYNFFASYNRRRRARADGRQQIRLSQLDAEYTEATSQLSQVLLGPVAAHLGKKRLLIVPDGGLSYVPFAALPAPALQTSAIRNASRPTPANPQPLIAEHEIINLPSASALAVLRRELAGRKPAPKAVAVLADPVFDKQDVRVRAAIKGEAKAITKQRGQRAGEPLVSPDSVSQTALLRSVKEVGLADSDRLPRLPYSRQEAEAIFAINRQAGVMKALDFRASRETALSAEMSQYRVIHFATHGLLNSEQPELGGLVLSLVDQQGKPQNGFFRLYDIYNMNLVADLVVLSACQTALGKQIRGEGLVGVTRGFMYAGAARVMASLWRVDDEATAELIKRFYAGMMREGQRPAAALRLAQLAMQKQKRWQSPYYWAGFILQGEWK